MTIASTQPRIRADIVLDLLARQERSQAWLARHMRVSSAQLTRVLKGDRPATLEFRQRLCQVLNLPEVCLFTPMPMHMDTETAEVAD
jgi:transcriptional regulator with XRE-family HTH domain